MTRHIRRLIVPCFCLACAAPALANSFSLYYEADGTFPEQEGWSRSTYHPSTAHVRAVDEGVFRINSLASPETADLYGLWGLSLMPGPGEYLRVDWRMRVLQQQDYGAPDWFGDAGMHIDRSYDAAVTF